MSFQIRGMSYRAKEEGRNTEEGWVGVGWNRTKGKDKGKGRGTDCGIATMDKEERKSLKK